MIAVFIINYDWFTFPLDAKFLTSLRTSLSNKKRTHGSSICIDIWFDTY